MTPLGLRVAAGVGAHLVSRPSGVLHAYTGPLTPSGRAVPRSGRAVCKTRTRTLRVVTLGDLADGRRQRVCGSCKARLASSPNGEAGPGLTRDQARAAYADVTPFDLAVDAWRCETESDIERLEWVALLMVGFRALRTEPVIAPNGKVNDPLDQLIARARRRVSGVRDPLSPSARAAAAENEERARQLAKVRRREAWEDREGRIERLGIDLATRRRVG